MEKAVLKTAFTKACYEWSDYLVCVLLAMVRAFQPPNQMALGFLTFPHSETARAILARSSFFLDMPQTRFFQSTALGPHGPPDPGSLGKVKLLKAGLL